MQKIVEPEPSGRLSVYLAPAEPGYPCFVAGTDHSAIASKAASHGAFIVSERLFVATSEQTEPQRFRHCNSGALEPCRL